MFYLFIFFKLVSLLVSCWHTQGCGGAACSVVFHLEWSRQTSTPAADMEGNELESSDHLRGSQIFTCSFSFKKTCNGFERLKTCPVLAEKTGLETRLCSA